MLAGLDPGAPQPTVAYFSMEIGLHPLMPTYSGGLGVLSGDTLRAAADMGLPVTAVSLLHRKGYFRQRLDAMGNQTEGPVEWSPGEFMEPLPPRARITIEGRSVTLRAWRFRVEGAHGHVVPVFLLDSSLPENDPRDQTLTDQLYGGDVRYRLCQEVVLGIGGIAMLRALGIDQCHAYHMNEGHSALLSLALLQEQAGPDPAKIAKEHIDAVRRRCVFTTHTPVSAGHDVFPQPLVRQVLANSASRALERLECCVDGALNMTHLALFFSRYINGVSMRHEQVARGMFPKYPINSITNGVHAGTWVAKPFQEIYDKHIPEWRLDNRYLRYIIRVPLEEIREAHARAKRGLLQEVERRCGVRLDPQAMTIGFARRAAPYKRADLLFSDMERLRRMAIEGGPLQLVYGGKAHPHDEGGKALIRRIFQAADALKMALPIVYLEDYDMDIAKYMCSGVDLWLNTPQKPQEASGTSGMKAAMNGVPSLSVLDGWWIEGHFEDVTGWSIGNSWEPEPDPPKESIALYDKLEYVMAMYYGRPSTFAGVMRSAIAVNGAFFNAQRMVSQYLENAYLMTLVP